MFGNDDNEQLTQDAAQSAVPDGTLSAAVTSPGTDAGAAVVDSSAQPSTYGDGGYSPSEPAAASDATAPAAAASTEPAATVPAPSPLLDDAADDDLLQIKQQALQQLSPLVGHLNQSPEEKFRTTMMMIQASDNQDLIKEAYAAAQQIQDEKTRAQALLDIVNEINYFTQHPAQ